MDGFRFAVSRRVVLRPVGTGLACLAAAVLGAGWMPALPASGQVSQEEHQRHHAGETPGPPTGVAPDGPRAGTLEGQRVDGASGTAEGCCDGDEQKALYAALMKLPELSPERRAEVERRTQENTRSSVALMAQGLDRLSRAAEADDFAAMQEATADVREGVARFESAVAARRALAEGAAPREIALAWFRREMSLSPRAIEEAASGPWGLSWFHAVVMLLLVGFAAAMLWMYYYKMRRASRLLGELTGGAAAATAPAAVAPIPGTAIAPEPSRPGVPGVATPLRWSGNLRVGRIFQETPNVKTFRLMNPLGGVLPFDFLPGQFLTVTVPTDGEPVKRSYTIASSPTRRDYAELTIKHEEGGVVSGFFHAHVKEGDLLHCSGPSGTFIFTGRECKCVLLIGGGVGVTPLMSVLRDLLDRSWAGDIFLLYTCRTPADIIFREELNYLQSRHPNLRVVVTISRPEGTDWKGPTGRITGELITQSVPDLPSRYVHICGPVPMMEATRRTLTELGVPRERIKVEAFGPAAGKVERAAPKVTAPAARGAEPGVSTVALPTVTFSKSDKSAALPPDKVVLEVAEENGVEIDYSCRVGVCGVCRIKMTSGQATMAVEDGLQPGDKEQGIILACQAKSTGDVTVEA